MSGFLGLGIEAALGLPPSRFRPASFRGAGFKVVEVSGEDGRFLAEHIFPLRDDHHVEDMGRRPRRYSIVGYVIGPDSYDAARDALIKATAGSDEVGTLVLPRWGEKRVRCESVRYTESMKEGGFCAFDLTFIEAGSVAPLAAQTSALAAALRQVGVVLDLARRAYALYRATNGNLGELLARGARGFAVTLAEDLANDWLGLPGLDLVALRGHIAALSRQDGTNADATAAAITAPYAALAAAAPLPRPGTTGDGATAAAVTSRPDRAAPAAVVTLLLARASEPATPDAPDVAAIVRLARDAAAAAAAEAALRANFDTADQALGARDALVATLAQRAEIAADQADDDLALAFRALAAEARRDLTARAAQLPARGPYAMAGTMPALALAQRLYGTAARADQLVQQNAPRHPAAMPRAGWMLYP